MGSDTSLDECERQFGEACARLEQVTASTSTAGDEAAVEQCYQRQLEQLSEILKLQRQGEALLKSKPAGPDGDDDGPRSRSAKREEQLRTLRIQADSLAQSLAAR